jgi:hypothetical protein
MMHWPKRNRQKKGLFNLDSAGISLENIRRARVLNHGLKHGVCQPSIYSFLKHSGAAELIESYQ